MDINRDKDRKTPPSAGRPLNDNLAQQILGSLASAYSGAETLRWLKNLDTDFPLLAGKDTGKSGEALQVAMIINQLFNDFQRYSIEFNKTIGDFDSRITCESPQRVQVAVDGEEPIILQGHLSTVSWALVVQAQEHKIHVYIIPSDRLLGFRMQRSAFSPYMEITGEAVAPGTVVWKVVNVNLNSQNLHRLSKKLFGHLFRVLNGLAQQTDKFVGDFTTPSTISSVMSTHKDAFAAKYDLAGQEPTNLPANPGLAQPQDLELLLHKVVSSSHRQQGSSLDLDDNARAIAHSLNEFGRLIERELESLVEKNKVAMHSQDIVHVQMIAKRTSTLKRFQEVFDQLAQDWQNAVHTD